MTWKDVIFGALRRTHVLEALRCSRLSRRVRRARAVGGADWIDRLPARLTFTLDLVGPRVEPLRVEIGGGQYPTAGYVHVDTDRRARHLEHLAPAWDLPFATGAVDEILAVHVLEHVSPALVNPTLREWVRVLRPGGTAQIHVPDAAALLPAYLAGDRSTKWAAMSAIFGMACDPDWPDAAIRAEPEHRALYDIELLSEALRRAGFDHIEDVSREVVDRHTEGWYRRCGIAGLSLIVRARVSDEHAHLR